MTIIHIVDPFAGGLATFLKLLTEQLREDKHIIIHGERKELVDKAEVKKIFPKENVKFIHWKSVQREISVVKDFQAYLELIQILRRFRKADAVHLHSSKAGFIGRLACKHVGISNVIYTPNGAPFLMSGISKVKSIFYSQLEKFAYHFGGKVVCSSASEQKEYLNRNIDASFINNGTKISKNSFLKDKTYQKFRIVTSGRIADQKNPEKFNEIALEFAGLNHFEFVWIGDGDEHKTLNSPNIQVTGWLSNEGVRNEIQKADLYLSTSYFEGLPFAVIEAMSLGKCLLLSDCTGNKDLVINGINGETFSNKEEAVNYIVYFYLNKSITETMGLNSIEICKDYFNIEETALRYKIEYQKVSGKMADAALLDQLFAKKSLSLK